MRPFGPPNSERAKSKIHKSQDQEARHHHNDIRASSSSPTKTIEWRPFMFPHAPPPTKGEEYFLTIVYLAHHVAVDTETDDNSSHRWCRGDVPSRPLLHFYCCMNQYEGSSSYDGWDCVATTVTTGRVYRILWALYDVLCEQGVLPFYRTAGCVSNLWVLQRPKVADGLAWLRL